MLCGVGKQQSLGSLTIVTAVEGREGRDVRNGEKRSESGTASFVMGVSGAPVFDFARQGEGEGCRKTE